MSGSMGQGGGLSGLFGLEEEQAGGQPAAGNPSSSAPPADTSAGTTAEPKKYEGLLDFMVEDEEKRKMYREKAQNMAKAASSMQPMAVSRPVPINVNGGLLQQPAIVPMTAPGTGITNQDPTKMEGGRDKFMELVGAFF